MGTSPTQNEGELNQDELQQAAVAGLPLSKKICFTTDDEEKKKREEGKWKGF